MRVLILSGRAPVALDHARRFLAQGATVFVADSVSCRLTSFTRGLSGCFKLPPPRYAARDFAAALERIITTERIDLVLPTCEEVFYLSRIRHRLPAACVVFAPPFELLRELHSKLRFLELAEDCGIATPPSARVDSLASARDWAGGRGVVLKPEFSRFGVHVRVYPQGIPTAAAPLPNVGPWVVQNFCAGRELCSYSIAVAGQLRAHVAYEPSYRLARSSGYYFEPVEIAGIQTFVEGFVARVKLTGQISFDWIVNAAGALNVIECNPRAISGLHLFARTDRLPAAIMGDREVCITPHKPKPRMLAAIMASAGLSQAIKKGQVARWREDWSRAIDVLAEPEDRAPLLGALIDMIACAGTAFSQSISLRAATTQDIEWDGEALPE